MYLNGMRTGCGDDSADTGMVDIGGQVYLTATHSAQRDVTALT